MRSPSAEGEQGRNWQKIDRALAFVPWRSRAQGNQATETGVKRTTWSRLHRSGNEP